MASQKLMLTVPPLFWTSPDRRVPLPPGKHPNVERFQPASSKNPAPPSSSRPIRSGVTRNKKFRNRRTLNRSPESSVQSLFFFFFANCTRETNAIRFLIKFRAPEKCKKKLSSSSSLISE
uniref:(northern house mosquito) hypothetical protein n=1 Tax=Culex pipiens TaxID=7175 RepID=A0A8D8IHZ2_CULPI